MLTLAVAAPQPSWAGIITAVASLFTALALIIAAAGAALVNHRTSKRIDENQKDTTARLAVIHTLVNSTLSAALQAQLDASRRELVMLLENVELQELNGNPPSDGRKTAIAALRRHVAELSEAMMTRDDQTRYANVQIAEEETRKAHRQE